MDILTQKNAPINIFRVHKIYQAWKINCMFPKQKIILSWPNTTNFFIHLLNRFVLKKTVLALLFFDQVPYMEMYPLALCTAKNCVFLNSGLYWITEQFIEIKAWLILMFFVCLQNQLSARYIPCSNTPCTDVWAGRFIKSRSNRQKMNGCTF